MDCFQNRESDIEGTAIRVASVTLESDSLSEAPKSFRSKRRKRIPKREKQLNMDLNFCDAVCSTTLVKNNDLKNKMEWESAIASTCSGISSSDFESDFELNGDADDEQSDWPEASLSKTKNFCKEISKNRSIFYSSLNLEPSKYLLTNKSCNNNLLNNNTIKLVEQFLLDVMQKELILCHVYKLSQIKKLLNNNASVQIIKQNKGTIILRKR